MVTHDKIVARTNNFQIFYFRRLEFLSGTVNQWKASTHLNKTVRLRFASVLPSPIPPRSMWSVFPILKTNNLALHNLQLALYCGLPTTAGKTTRGFSSFEKPALQKPEPLSITTTVPPLCSCQAKINMYHLYAQLSRKETVRHGEYSKHVITDSVSSSDCHATK